MPSEAATKSPLGKRSARRSKSTNDTDQSKVIESKLTWVTATISPATRAKKMSHTSELLDQIKTARNLSSDYALAELLGITRAAISSYRRGISHADDRIAVMLADALQIDRFKTIARINADRAKKAEERAWWKRLASAAAIVMAVYTSVSPGSATAQGPSLLAHNPGQVHIMSNWIASFLRLARSLIRYQSSTKLNGFCYATALR